MHRYRSLHSSRPYAYHVSEREGVIVDILTLPHLIPLHFASFLLFTLLPQVSNDSDGLGQ